MILQQAVPGRSTTNQEQNNKTIHNFRTEKRKREKEKKEFSD